MKSLQSAKKVLWSGTFFRGEQTAPKGGQNFRHNAAYVRRTDGRRETAGRIAPAVEPVITG